MTRVPHDHCACCYLRRKKFNHTELWKLCLAGGTGLLISRGQPTENATVELFENGTYVWRHKGFKAQRGDHVAARLPRL